MISNFIGMYKLKSKLNYFENFSYGYLDLI